MNKWIIKYKGWKPSDQPLRETLCSLGNGYFVTRGAAEESRAGKHHYPGTYLAGGYNRVKSEVAGKIIENEDLVNWPNWLSLTFRQEGGEWFNLGNSEVLSYNQKLDLKKGILKRNVRVKDEEGHITQIKSSRFVHVSKSHYAAIRWELKPENWSGPVEIRSALDGKIINAGVERYKGLNNKHLQPIKTERIGEDAILLLVQTCQSHIQMAQAARTHIYCGDEDIPAKRTTKEKEGYIAQHIFFKAEKMEPVIVEKIVSIYTSKDYAISECSLEATTAISRAPGFYKLLKDHISTWASFWHRCNIEIEGDSQSQLVLRLHIFHLLQTVSPLHIDVDAGVPARGWHGEAYRGHIFWDELFIFPFLNFRIPERTRELLMYRYRRLPEARYAAETAGYKGAMFPWQSGSNGREESQHIHLNPVSGRWLPDYTHLQRHINAAIVYNVWHYYEATHDREFLSAYGAELILDIASFFSGMASFNAEKDRYEILHVVGPDEYHTYYPGSKEPGLRNNAYTNIMAVWTFQSALEVLDIIGHDRRNELLSNLGIDEEELQRWDKISRNMFVPFVNQDIISQFEGYEDLKELDWEKYHREYGEHIRLDRILEKEDDDVNKYKASKQADILMLFYLFSSEELMKLMHLMGYKCLPECIPKNIEYYEKRTSHGSTLSRLIHSWVYARSDRERSWHSFEKALMSDFSDVQGGTTPEGIHLGAMAGTVDMVQRCYTGLELREDILWLNPQLPENLTCVRFHIRYRSHWLLIRATHEKLHIHLEKSWTGKVKIGVKEEVFELKLGKKKEFDLTRVAMHN